MDLVAGAGSVFSQLAVGLAGGIAPEATGGMANGLFKMGGRLAPKPTVDSLPDKVRGRGWKRRFGLGPVGTVASRITFVVTIVL